MTRRSLVHDVHLTQQRSLAQPWRQLLPRGVIRRIDEREPPQPIQRVEDTRGASAQRATAIDEHDQTTCNTRHRVRVCDQPRAHVKVTGDVEDGGPLSSGPWPSPLMCFEGGPGVAVDFALPDRLALVVDLLTLGERDQHLDASSLEVHLKRHEGKPFYGCLAE
jgi:hypothetical protein